MITSYNKTGTKLLFCAGINLNKCHLEANGIINILAPFNLSKRSVNLMDEEQSVFLHTHTHTHTHTYTHIYIYTHTYTHTHTHSHTNTHIHTHIHKHTHIHTHKDTHTLSHTTLLFIHSLPLPVQYKIVLPTGQK
jgi:hypothetical protein